MKLVTDIEFSMEEIVYGRRAFESFAEESAERLSFSDLPWEDSNTNSGGPKYSAQPDPLFEFFTPKVKPADQNGVLFCGKVIKSQSLRKPEHGGDAAYSRRSAASSRFAGGVVEYHAQRVNITSLTSMSAKSRRRMFMFGPVKFKPEMELSAIKQRQARRPPTPAPAPEVMMSGVEVMRPSLRGRSSLASLFSRSFGCIPAAARGSA